MDTGQWLRLCSFLVRNYYYTTSKLQPFFPVVCTNTAPYESRAAQPSNNARLTIDTPQGAVMGYRDRLTARFQGIPYAQPPVGERSFKAPEKLGTLHGGNSTPYDATYYRSICPVRILVRSFGDAYF